MLSKWLFKDLPRKTASNKVVSDKEFNVAENLKYDGNQRGFGSLVYKFFDKKLSGTNISATCTNKFAGCAFKDEIMSNQELARELHKPVIRK